MSEEPPPEDPDLAALVAARIRDVPDFPKPGVQFKDLTPLFADARAFAAVVDGIVGCHRGRFDVVAGVEARGFILGAAVAYAAGTGVVPIRKAGKLPWHTLSASYELEYGSAAVEVHRDAFAPGQRVLLVDDVLATGGTMAAAVELVARAGGDVQGISVILELSVLNGRQQVPQNTLQALLTV